MAKTNMTTNFEGLFKHLAEEKKIEVLLASNEFKGKELRSYTEPKDTVSLLDMDGVVMTVAGWVFYTMPDRVDVSKTKTRVTFKDSDGNTFTTQSSRFVNGFANIISDLRDSKSDMTGFQIVVTVRSNSDDTIKWYEVEQYEG